MGGGLCWLDYDGDGWLDLYVVNSHSEDEAARWEDEGALPRNALFHNDGGGFVDATDGSGAGVAVRGTGCVAADLDLDGHTDLYVTTATTGVLLWNNGDGTFREGAAAAGVDAPGWYAGAAVGDVNRDGWPDLFLAGYASLGSPIEGATLGFPNTYSGVRDLLYLSEGAGRGRGVTFKRGRTGGRPRGGRLRVRARRAVLRPRRRRRPRPVRRQRHQAQPAVRQRGLARRCGRRPRRARVPLRRARRPGRSGRSQCGHGRRRGRLRPRRALRPVRHQRQGASPRRVPQLAADRVLARRSVLCGRS